MASEKDSPGSKTVTSCIHSDKWAVALERLSAEDRKQFDVAAMSDRSPRDILSDLLEATNRKKDECMKKRWKVTIKGRTIVLRDVLEKIAVWVTNFKSIVSSLASLDPIAAGLPWAAVCFILQAGVNDMEIFGFVLQSLESISKTLVSVAILKDLFFSHAHRELAILEKFADGIVALNAAILQFLAEMLRYYSQRTATRFIKSVGLTKSDFQEKYEPIKTAKEEIWELLDLASSELDNWMHEKLDHIGEVQQQHQRALIELIENLERPIDRINKQLDSIEDGLEREKRIRILRSISSIPYTSHHKAAKKGRLGGSGQWLLDNEAFQSWRCDSTSSVLWLHGIPGSGKTKLTSLIIDELTGSENMAYFYCVRDPAEPLRGQCDAILASLVRQLSGTSTDSGILPAVIAPYQDALDDIVGFEDFAWTSDESSAILLELLENYPAATIVIDALDEVNLEDRQELMDILSELLRESPNLLKIFVSSRDNYDITLHFEGSPNVHIDAHDNQGDIESFIEDRLTAARLLRGRLTTTLQTKIADTLLDGAQGMFRWVDLQIQSLRPLKVAADIEARLGVLPATLEESYWHVYQEILTSGDHATDLAVFTFQWVMYAEAVVEAHDFAKFASFALSSADVSQTFTEIEIIDVCANLIVKHSGILQFAHLSVREFLEALPNRSVDTMLAEPSHGRISGACLSYLSLKQPERPVEETNEWVELELFQVHPEPPDVLGITDGYTDSGIRLEERLSETSGFTAFSTATSNIDQPQAGEEEENFNAPLAISADDSPWTTKESENKNRNNNNNNNNKGTRSAAEQLQVSNHVKFLVVRTDRNLLEYTSQYWPNHASKSGSIRMEKPLRNAIREFMVDDKTKIVTNCFRFWCSSVRQGLAGRIDYNRLDYKKLFDASDAPANPIWLACFQGWLDVVEYLYGIGYSGIGQERYLTFYAYPFEKGSRNSGLMSTILYATEADDHQLAEKLLSLPPGQLQVDYQTILQSLIRQAKSGNELMVALLLANPDCDLAAEKAAFVAAAETASDRICRLLLNHNPDLFMVSGESAFLAACEKGHFDTAKSLVERAVSIRGSATDHNAQPVDVSVEGTTSVFNSCRSFNIEGWVSRVMEEAAVHSHSVLLNEILLRGWGDSGKAKALVISISQNDGECIELLRRFGASNDPGAVHRALIDKKPLAALRLIKHGFSVTEQESPGSPLHEATKLGNDRVVAAILDAGAEVNGKNNQKQTPLHLAANGGSTECTRLLLHHGADVLAEDDQGNIPLDVAEESGMKDCEALIRERMQQLMEELTLLKESRGQGEVASIVPATSGTSILPSKAAPADA